MRKRTKPTREFLLARTCLLLSVSLFCSGCETSNFDLKAASDTSLQRPIHDFDYMSLIKEYIAKNKKWPASKYEVVRISDRGNLICFYIRYKFIFQTGRNHTGSDGKSFVMLIDPETKSVDSVLMDQ